MSETLPTTTDQAPRTIAHLLAAKQKQIAAVLPKHLTAERLLRIAVTEIRRTPALEKCSPASLISCVITSAQLGLEPGGHLGHAYLVPFKTKMKTPQGDRWVNEAQLIIGYRGMISLARRTGSISTFQAEAVFEKDHFVYSYGLEPRLEHIPATGDRGPFVKAWCLVRFKDGGFQFVVMEKHDIDKIMRNTQSKGEWGPWRDHYEEMAKKTAVRRLFKFLPVSIEDNMARAMELDERAEASIPQEPPTGLDWAQDEWAGAEEGEIEEPNGQTQAEGLLKKIEEKN